MEGTIITKINWSINEQNYYVNSCYYTHIGSDSTIMPLDLCKKEKYNTETSKAIDLVVYDKKKWIS